MLLFFLKYLNMLLMLTKKSPVQTQSYVDPSLSLMHFKTIGIYNFITGRRKLKVILCIQCIPTYTNFSPKQSQTPKTGWKSVKNEIMKCNPPWASDLSKSSSDCALRSSEE